MWQAKTNINKPTKLMLSFSSSFRRLASAASEDTISVKEGERKGSCMCLDFTILLYETHLKNHAGGYVLLESANCSKPMLRPCQEIAVRRNNRNDSSDHEP